MLIVETLNVPRSPPAPIAPLAPAPAPIAPLAPAPALDVPAAPAVAPGPLLPAPDAELLGDELLRR
jgi:hypothetical protein